MHYLLFDIEFILQAYDMYKAQRGQVACPESHS